MRRLILAAATAAVLWAPGALAETLRVTEHATLGPYITDDNGMALYMFEEDRQEGDRGRSVESDCIDDCLSRWPTLGGDPLPTAGEGIDASLIGSFTRPDGKVQAIYNGWPLYYFAEDFVAGDINGHDFEEFGGEWYLLSPAGVVIGDPDEDRRHEDNDDD